jgi:hypothetical protein
MNKIKISLILTFILSIILFAGCNSIEKKKDIIVVDNEVFEEKYIKYNVIKGDCLWDISSKDNIYNDPFMWVLIYKENLDEIENPDIIEIGQELKIKTLNNIGDVEKNMAIKIAREYKE